MNVAKAKFFDAEVDAPWATAPYGPEDQPRIRRLLAEARVGPRASVLEPGCGTGRLTAILAAAVGPEGRVMALDISRRMVEACRARVGSRRWVQVQHAAVEECAIGPETFDAVVCHQAFPHFDDQRQALTVMARALKPHGRLVVVHFNHAAKINATHRRAGAPIQGDRLPARREMRRLCRAAGLTVDALIDDQLGYLLRASRPEGASR